MRHKLLEELFEEEGRKNFVQRTEMNPSLCTNMGDVRYISICSFSILVDVRPSLGCKGKDNLVRERTLDTFPLPLSKQKGGSQLSQDLFDEKQII